MTIAQGKRAQRVPPWVTGFQFSSPSPPTAGGEGRGEEGVDVETARPK